MARTRNRTGRYRLISEAKRYIGSQGGDLTQQAQIGVFVEVLIRSMNTDRVIRRYYMRYLEFV